MIRHVVFFSFDAAADDQQRNAVLKGLMALPDHFPDMKDFALGPNVSKRDSAFAYGMTMRFDTIAQLEAYLDSERHERFVAQQFRPAVSQRAIVSFAEPGHNEE